MKHPHALVFLICLIVSGFLPSALWAGDSVIIGATPQQERFLTCVAQISAHDLRDTPHSDERLTVVILEHHKFLEMREAFHAHKTKLAFSSLQARRIYLSARMFRDFETLLRCITHELGHFATQSVYEDHAERAADRIEYILALGYALGLALTAFMLEWVAGHAHRRSLAVSTAGFTYHPEKDIWRCPQDQHLFPVFSDSARGTVLYRAPAAACNACPSKAACTDSSQGREIERSDLNGLEYGMKRFQRAVSLTLLVLASLILVVELFRTGGLYPRIVLASALTLFCVLIGRLSAKLSQGVQSSQSPQNVDV